MTSFNHAMSLIVSAINQFEQQLTPDRPVDLARFVQGRLALSRAVNDFLSNEWTNLRQNIDEGFGGDRGDREALHAAFMKLRGDYSRHITRWDSGSLVKEWTTYRHDCQVLMSAMRNLLMLRSRVALPHAA